MKDNVNHPSHYTQGNIECIDAMISAFGKQEVAAFCRCNAFKYIWRSPYKGNELEDIEKAKWYENKFKELRENPFVNYAKQMRDLSDSKNSLISILDSIYKEIYNFAEKGLYSICIGKEYSYDNLDSVQCRYIASDPLFAKMLKLELEDSGFNVEIKELSRSSDGNKTISLKINW